MVYLWAMVFPYFLRKLIEEKAKKRKNREELEKIHNAKHNIEDGFKYFCEMTYE
jgi:hypothetical protein